MLLKVVILAAGQGKRMYSSLPKVLHNLAGKPLLQHVVETASHFDWEQQPIVVYGHQGQQVREALSHLRVTWVNQVEQLGTGHALQQSLPCLGNSSHVLVLYGDIPLTSAKTLQALITNTPLDALGIITAHMPNPAGYGGRIIRDTSNKVVCVIEEKEASAAQLEIKEVNSGFYLIPVAYLSSWLTGIQNNNVQQEYYLTDIIQIAAQAKVLVHTTHPHCYEEILGINNQEQLARLQQFYQTTLASR